MIALFGCKTYIRCKSDTWLRGKTYIRWRQLKSSCKSEKRLIRLSAAKLVSDDDNLDLSAKVTAGSNTQIHRRENFYQVATTFFLSAKVTPVSEEETTYQAKSAFHFCFKFTFLYLYLYCLRQRICRIGSGFKFANLFPTPTTNSDSDAFISIQFGQIYQNYSKNLFY